MKPLIALVFIGSLMLAPAYAQNASGQKTANVETNAPKGSASNGNPFALQPLQQNDKDKNKNKAAQKTAAGTPNTANGQANSGVAPQSTGTQADGTYCHELKNGAGIHCHEQSTTRQKRGSYSDARRQRLAEKEGERSNGKATTTEARAGKNKAVRGNQNVYKMIIQQK